MALKRMVETEAARKARKLRWAIENGLEKEVSAQDKSWLKAYEAREAKAQAKALKDGAAAEKRAEARAKQEGRSVTLADFREAQNPTPSTRGRSVTPNRVADQAGALAVAIQEHEVETLALATALAFGSLPRTPENKEVRKLARMGKNAWVVVTFAPRRKREGGIMFGSDLVGLIALTELARTRTARIEFESMADLLAALDGSREMHRGGKQKQVAFERLRRIRNTSITIAFYTSEEDARAEKNELRLLDVTLISDYWNPEREEFRGEQPLFKPWLEISPAYTEYVAQPKTLTFLPTTMVHAFIGHPLKLQFAAWLYPRCMAAASLTRVPMRDLIEQFGEGRESRLLIRDLQIALNEIKEFYNAAGRSLNARFVEGAHGKIGAKGGRPSKTWDLEIGLSDKLTGIKTPRTLGLRT